MTVFDKFRNCITEPRCRDCEGIPGVCEEDHQTVRIPKVLALDVLNKLKEQEQRISVLQRAIENAPKTDKLLDVYGKYYAKIVRCKDCKFYPDGEGTTKWVPCREIITTENWFCADGKPKEFT